VLITKQGVWHSTHEDESMDWVSSVM